MARTLASLVLVLVAIAISCNVNSVAAESVLTPDTRFLRNQVDESVTTTTTSDTSHSGSNSSSSSGPVQTSSTINTEASAAESTEKEHKGPTLMSFVGPAIAGVLAIVLIGAVVAFKNRMGK